MKVSEVELLDLEFDCEKEIGIEITISNWGDRIWINDTRGKCIVRICNIKAPIKIVDSRPKKTK